jgi:hypothetical protein
VIADEAYQSILQAHTPLPNRSEEAARRALACAEALIGSSAEKSFGWTRRQKRARILHDQLELLQAHAMDIDPPGEFIGAGGEHDVWHSDRGAFVSKVTNHGQFGFVVDQESDNRSNKLTLRPALPSECLLRMGSENVVFGDSIRLEAIQRNQPPSWIVAQPYVDQGRPPQSDIDTFMEQCGFRQVPRRMVMSQYHDKPF